MKILVACEYSGVVRDAFREFGHDAYSCDLLPNESPYHIQADAVDTAYDKHQKWDLMIAHPPCTYLCSSGMHWNSRKNADGSFTEKALERQQKTEEALYFVKELWFAPIEKICIENPVGILNSQLPFLPRPQYIQPYEYGHDASKKTGLWLKNLPPLGKYEEDYVEPRVITRGEKNYFRWSNQTDSGQNRLGQSATRGLDRAKTYTGIAYAMVEAWGL